MPSMKGARPAVAGLVTLLCVVLIATPAAASSTVNLGPQPPTSPVRVVVGDQIVVSLPPLSFTPAPGHVINGDPRYPLPTSSDGTVLPRLSAAYQADGTAVAVFQAAAAGTATIRTTTPELQFCTLSTPTPTPTPKPTPTPTPLPPTTSSLHGTSTAQLASTTATPSPSFSQCAESVALYQVTVVVSATGVQGITIPSTGAGPLESPVGMITAAAVVLIALTAGAGSLRRWTRRRNDRAASR